MDEEVAGVVGLCLVPACEYLRALGGREEWLGFVTAEGVGAHALESVGVVAADGLKLRAGQVGRFAAAQNQRHVRGARVEAELDREGEVGVRELPRVGGLDQSRARQLFVDVEVDEVEEGLKERMAVLVL